MLDAMVIFVNSPAFSLGTSALVYVLKVAVLLCALNAAATSARLGPVTGAAPMLLTKADGPKSLPRSGETASVAGFSATGAVENVLEPGV